ncbi:MAG: glutamate--tRNA ligase, partial [Magnetococcus sp. WYHC-3]
LDDLVLIRSDGSPTYNLAVVVDDHDMGITHVIRGEDHTSNTPRQIQLYRALGWAVPTFAHMPLLHGEDGAKLSKRHGAVSVLQYRDDGFLPEAVINYLVRLGWSHGDQEIFSMDDMIRLFDIAHVGRSASVFNASKLLWLNGHYMKAADPETLAVEMLRQLTLLGVSAPDATLARAVLPHMRERAKTVREMAELSRFFFEQSGPAHYDDAAFAKHVTADILPALDDLVATLAALPGWEAQAVTAGFDGILARHGLKMPRLAQPVRIALTGGTVSPGIHETLVLLGRERTLARLQQACGRFRERLGIPGAGPGP